MQIFRHITQSEQLHLLFELLRWLLIASIAGVLAGSASAFLLASLNLATTLRESHPWLIILLPVAGLSIGCLYKYVGASVEAGNNLILDEVHDPQATIPLRMTPLILLGTFLTHLCGGSAGREGTAIQTGASLADQITRVLGLGSKDRRILLMAGISGGFGSVFGTPLAGAVFGLEVLAIGRLGYEAIFPCFVGAFVGDYVTHAWGVRHTIYTVTQVAQLRPVTFLAAIAAGSAFGVTAMLFVKATHTISYWFKTRIAWGPGRPFLGGLVVAGAVFISHTTRYIGLGIPTIVGSFKTTVPWYAFAAKFGLTAVTLGSGFKGGEVTPLFFIGSTLGNALSHILPLPASLLAGMGFVGVFAGAANTPISSSLMAVELFGSEAGTFAAIACVVSYLFSGHSGIYHAQRVGQSKHASLAYEEGLSLAIVGKGRKDDGAEPGGLFQMFSLMEKMEMADVSVLRLYFSAADMRQHDSWWRRMMPQSLGPHLLQQAKSAGIEQALLHRVIGGFLKNQNLVMDGGEISPARLPQCLELIAEESILQAFLKENHDHLTRVRIVFLRGEEARIEAAIDKEEFNRALSLERSEHLLD